MALTKSVIFIEDKKQETEKAVEFTHYLCEENGWETSADSPRQYNKVVYIGKCARDGDMFSADDEGYILIFKGHLNSGKY